MTTLTQPTRTVTGTLSPPQDAELPHLPRIRPLTYQLTLPTSASEQHPAQGLLVYLPGFGADTDEAYLAKLRQNLASTFNYAVVTLDYHCYYARPEQGATLQLNEAGKALLPLLYKSVGLPLSAPLEVLGQHLSQPIDITGYLVPPQAEYQNFGVLQAMDVVTLLHHLHQHPTNSPPVAWGNVVLAGSSHGGYIAHMVAKLIPNTIRAVIDNSSYTRTAMAYIGLSSHPEFKVEQGNAKLALSTISAWQLTDRSLPTYFGLAPQAIRDLALSQHVQATAHYAQRLPDIYAFHSSQDTFIAPLAEKLEQAQLYTQAGYPFTLKQVTQADIDGKRFKALTHGMQASMQTLCHDVLTPLADTSAPPTVMDWETADTLAYACGNKLYSVEFDSLPRLQIT
jgi:pimeloyl-ACP methyl ester carboxylesterase